MNYTITKEGCVLQKDKFSDHEINWIKSDLTVRPHTNFIDKKETFKVYLEDDNSLCIPKFYAKEKFSFEYFSNDIAKNINTDFLFELRDEQKSIITPILNAYQNNGGGILSLPCGFGKTIIALYFISLLKKQTLIIVHRKFLITHWMDKIKECLKDIKICVIQSNTKNIPECDIAICMLQTLSIKDFPKDFFNSFGHIIIDECHLVSTTVFSSIFFKINSKYMLGLSATPERKDRMTKVIKWHIGDVIKLDFVKHLINIDVKRFVLNCNKEFLLSNDNKTFSDKLTNIINNNVRNNIIVNVIIEEYNKCKDRHFLLLSDRIEHLQRLKNIFDTNHTKTVESVGFFIGGMNKEELKLSSKCKIILATYSMASEGLDIPTLNSLILASPKNDVFQTIGRISRLQENKYIKPLIIDFIDILPVFINESNIRLDLYKKNNYDIIDYIYNEKNKIFEINMSNNKNYNIYLVDQKIETIKKNEIDKLFDLFKI